MNLALRHETESVATTAIMLAGEEVVLDPRGVMFVPRLSLLAVSDLHLEKGSSFARRGALVPPYDSRQTLLRLAPVVAEYDPAIVVSLGDSFHDDGGLERMHGDCRQLLLTVMGKRDWYWIAGNHDPAPPRDVPGTATDELAAGNLLFRHEPARGPQPGEVAGHLHPAATLVRRGRAVRRPCFVSDGERMIMPAFGAYTGTLNIRDRAYCGLFDEAELTAYMIGPDRLYAIAAARL